MTARFLADWPITQVIKPSGTFSGLQLGKYAAAIEEEIVAVGSSQSIVFVFDISTNPAKELAVLSSPDGTNSDKFGDAVSVNRRYGILIGAPHHAIGSKLEGGIFILVYTNEGRKGWYPSLKR